MRNATLPALQHTVTIALPAQAGRRPIFEQIDLPHPYYYHELYLPQLTGGPASVAFSPDSREVVYSMAGSLWRQRLDSGVAVQLTDGPGYDYQPDWSPDGSSIVYVSYRGGALELCLLDLASGTSHQLTHDGAVNVEPRFSPDGRTLAFVSTVFNRHFHVFVAPVTNAGIGAPVRLTGETKSPLRRYYYSAYDHEISPVWTRDGRSIIYVSNSGHIHGTGGFWQMQITPGSEAREIHYEETNWRARPDVSPDGTRLIYSSYLGRNWHQLWLMPVRGGDALPISYGEFDAVGARWSPDGRQIAYLSNENGGLELRLHDVIGGAERTLTVTERRTLRPTGRLELHLRDATGAPVAGRVSVTTPDGRFYAPAGAWIHGDDGFDRSERPFEAHYFHAKGDIALDVPAGRVKVGLLQGLRREPAGGELTVEPGRTATLGASWNKLDSPAIGGGHWVSGDAHVHMNYGGLYRNDPAHLVLQAEAEDLDVVNALIVNKEQRIPDIAYSGRGIDPASTPQHIVLHGQEYHTSYWGHLGILGPSGTTLLPGYAGYPNTAAASLAPTNADVADLAHARGALVGYVHPFDETPHPFDASERQTNELPVDVALGKVDYIEILGFADYRVTAEVWYRLLNLGFRLPTAGGSDAMANYASLRGPVGMNRVYVRVPEGPLDVRAWLAGLKAGRTFATNGPMLEFTLAGEPVGGELHFARAPASVPFTARMTSIVPVDHLEVVCNGKVVRQLALDRTRTGADVKGQLPLNASGWCLLRASSDHAEYPVLDNYVYATTSPVYVTVADQRPRAPAEARYFLAWIDRVTEATSAYPDWNSAAEKAAVLAELKAARTVYESLQ
jgi:Tol biopolymer transport system component